MNVDWVFLILRTARRFDWFEPIDLVVALDVPSRIDDYHLRNSFDTTVRRLVRRGHLERIGQRKTFRYQITEQGRLEYERLIQRRAA